jgi:hypothetical protein
VEVDDVIRGDGHREGNGSRAGRYAIQLRISE